MYPTVSAFTAAPDPVNFEAGLPSVDEIYARIYPSSDVMSGMDAVVGPLGSLGGADSDPDDL